jgi:histidyl-tRNA synthetase
MGADAKRAMIKIIEQLRSSGIKADMAFGDRGLKGAMKGADRAGAKVALVLGDRELENGTIAVKDLRAHHQEDVALDSLGSVIKQKLQIS